MEKKEENKMMDIVIPKQTYILLPQGTYRGIIDSIEKVQGRFGDQIKFKIRINTDGVEGLEGEEIYLSAWASASYSEKTKLFRWNRATLGAEFNPDSSFSAVAIKGKRVLVVVESRASTDGAEYNRVSDLLATPLGKKPQTAAPPQPVAPSIPDNDIPW
jgi:hypothetical protein